MTTADEVNLTNCDREPIHKLGAIQSFAYLLAFDQNWVCTQVSENIGEIFGKPGDFKSWLGKHATDMFDRDAVHTIRTRTTILKGDDSVERQFAVPLFGVEDSRLFDAAMHRSGDSYIVELEPSAKPEASDPAAGLRTTMHRLDQAKDIGALLDEAARIMRVLIGFDRVMVYQFDRSGNGSVVAEALLHGIDSFKGLNYPASDIPKQARALYIRTPFRIIADVRDTPVSIYPGVDGTGEPIDLSLSISRSVSPIHIEYLSNMGIDASLSVSIIVDGALWGLFACHHYSPCLPSFSDRNFAEMFGQLFSLKLEARLRKQASEQERRARTVGDQLLSAIASDPDKLADADYIREHICEVIDCDGVATYFDGDVRLSGDTPPPDMVYQLVRRLNEMEGSSLFVFENLSDLLPSAGDVSHLAAGFMAIPISRKPRDYVFLFRPEKVRAVNWAGDPNKPVTVGKHGARLTPRGSFDLWKEEVRNRCMDFTESEIFAGEALRHVLAEVVLRVSDRAKEQTLRMTEQQELLIAELNHRVRNILTLIRSIVRQSTGDNFEDFSRMVEDRIGALARAHDQITRDSWAPASLRQLIEAEADAYLMTAANRVDYDGQDILLEPTAYSNLALVIHELMTNSAKYGALSDSGRVAVKWHRDDRGDLHICWQESGGPPVQAPKRRGFGTTIIQRTIPHELGGEAKQDFQLSGVVAKLVIPSRFLSTGSAAQTALTSQEQAADNSAETQVQIKSILVVEDSLLIALDLEDQLRSFGVDHVSVASTAEQAFAMLDKMHFDAAILDYNLGSGTSEPVASFLTEHGTPFLFATGYGTDLRKTTPFVDAPVIQKPFDTSQLHAALVQLRP